MSPDATQPDRPANRFIVTSHGWSASHWLAYNLNRHPDITCLHSSAALIADQDEPYDVLEMLEQRDFKQILALITAMRAGYADRKTRTPADVYDAIDTQGGPRLIGSVHTFRLRDLPAIQDELQPAQCPIRIANLLRHPICLVNSGVGQFALSLRLDLNELQWTTQRIVDAGLPIFEQIAAEHGLFPGDIEVLSFLGACVTLRGLADDFAARDQLVQQDAITYLGTIRKEDVTHDPDCLTHWIKQLNGDDFAIPHSYLDSVYSDRKRNIHNATARTDDPAAIFAQWHIWQQQAFAYCLDRFGLRGPYEAEGYDLSMVPDWTSD